MISGTFKKILEKTKQLVSDFATNFGISAESITEILRKFLKFLTDFVEVFKILILGDNVEWKLQGNSILILGKLQVNIGVILNIIHFADVMKKFWKRFFEILMKFVEKSGKPLYKFLSILMEILYYFHVSFWKNMRVCGKHMQLLVSI